MTVSSGTLRTLAAAEAALGPRVFTLAQQRDLAVLLADTMDALDMVRGMLRFSEDQEAGDKMLDPLLARFRALEERAGDGR